MFVHIARKDTIHYCTLTNRTRKKNMSKTIVICYQFVKHRFPVLQTISIHRFIRALQHWLILVQCLLSTATVLVTDSYSCKRHCRAVLDSGSMINFISKSLLNILQLSRCPWAPMTPSSQHLWAPMTLSSQHPWALRCLNRRLSNRI